MKSDQNRVTLKDMDLDSAGQFRCEISAEAPLFNTVSQSRPLSIIGLYKDILTRKPGIVLHKNTISIPLK